MWGINNILGSLVEDGITGPLSEIMAFIRAAVRDMKSYIVSKNYRSISVKYAISDNDSTNKIAKYLIYGDSNTAVDFLDINNRE